MIWLNGLRFQTNGRMRMSEEKEISTPEEFAEMLSVNADDTIDWIIRNVGEGENE